MEEIKGIARVKFHLGKVEEWKRLTSQANRDCPNLAQPNAKRPGLQPLFVVSTSITWPDLSSGHVFARMTKCRGETEARPA